MLSCSMAGDFQQRIQDHYEDPYQRGRCDYATHAAESESTCSDPETTSDKDIVAIEVRVDDDVVREVWFDGMGCHTSQAFASMLAEVLEGQRTDSVVNLSIQAAMDLLNLKYVASSRLDCCKLALETIQLALNSDRIDLEDGPTFGGPDLGDEC